MSDPAPDRWEQIKTKLVTCGLVGGIILLVIVIPKWGYRSPCAWFQRHDYERRFYVFLYPQAGETKA